MTSPAPSTSPTNAPLAAPPINRIWNSPCPPPKNAACPMSAGRSSTPLNLFMRSEEHTSELQSQSNLVCRLLLEKQNPGETSRLSLCWALLALLIASARGLALTVFEGQQLAQMRSARRTLLTDHLPASALPPCGA